MTDNKNTKDSKCGDPLYELIEAIQSWTEFGHPITKFELIETHISYILLTGPYAYKFKKHLNLGFLNFSTLERRKRCCEEEVRLNSRTAPELYIAVVAITGNRQNPQFGGDSQVLEYAVKMLQFPKHAELNHVLDDGRLSSESIDILAQKIADFHQSATVIPLYHPSGSNHIIDSQSEDNFFHVQTFLKEYSDEYRKLQEIRSWAKAEYRRLNWQFITRKHQGYIRDCHGDLHLRNIILYNDELCAFDCLEFSDELRQIDVISDIAFLLMDFEARSRSEPAWRFLNSYLEHTGDYRGVSLLRFYKLYRAMVRIKVACIRLQQAGLSEVDKEQQWADLRIHLELALKYTSEPKPKLIIMHGLSGCGKTTLSQQLLEELGAIRIRSDLIRKHLHKLPDYARTNAMPGEGIYTDAESTQTYKHIADMAKHLLDDGYTVIVDAAFLHIRHRNQFQDMANTAGIPFIILDLQANNETLLNRIEARSKCGHSISEANVEVLKYQFASEEPLTKMEINNRVAVNTEIKTEIADMVREIDRKTTHDSLLFHRA